jgi:chemotaxis protein CheD
MMTAILDPKAQHMEGHNTSSGYFHAELGAIVINVPAGAYQVSGRADVVLSCTLGSCIAAAIYDPLLKIGGLNHFMLPNAPRASDKVSEAARYGSVAMERLINAMLKQGARRETLQVKLFGGGNVITSSTAIGSRNAEFARSYLLEEGLNIVGEDIGGTQGRSVRFYPHLGRAQRRLIGGERIGAIVASEQKFMVTLKKGRLEGEVELF